MPADDAPPSPTAAARPARIEDYALVGDLATAALIGRDGSIDWLCLPRFDAPACFARLLGSEANGRFRIAPADPDARVSRAYRDGTAILETRFETASGAVTLIDFMPIGEPDGRVDLVRIVQGERGSVALDAELVLRFDYGQIVPWLTQRGGDLHAVAGPDAVRVRSSVPFENRDFRSRARFTLGAGDSASFVLTCHRSHRPAPEPIEPGRALGETEAWWRDWIGRSRYDGPYRAAVERSLVTLKALTFRPTGGIVAAPTTSLPEAPGGTRNWDYRYCWIRDATFTLYALVLSGYEEEATAWRDWLCRATAGQPDQLQIMYGLAGERRLIETEIPWLAGFGDSRPVRVGNAAHGQFQLDVYGELIDALYFARGRGLPPDPTAWGLQEALTGFVEGAWQEPDDGIWEVRGPRRNFTHSKVMAWVAADRMVKAIDRFGLDGPRERWAGLRDAIRRDVLERAWNAGRGTLTRVYGGRSVDASLLLLPLVGFLPAGDPRMAATIATIERELCEGGLVRRYAEDDGDAEDGLPGREGTFLACSFWLADARILGGRREEGRALYERLLGLANDVGLLAEEYDPRAGRQLGNFPQAFSHVGVINTAHNLADTRVDRGAA
ncbi:MAG: glycoside hydrolase family 15 protein [Azospirillaceae bacterium]